MNTPSPDAGNPVAEGWVEPARDQQSVGGATANTKQVANYG